MWEGYERRIPGGESEHLAGTMRALSQRTFMTLPYLFVTRPPTMWWVHQRDEAIPYEVDRPLSSTLPMCFWICSSVAWFLKTTMYSTRDREDRSTVCSLRGGRGGCTSVLRLRHGGG